MIWHWRFLVGLVLHLTLLFGSVWRVVLEGCAGSRGDFLFGCPNALAASDACFVTDRWFTPQFSVLARFRIDVWMAAIFGLFGVRGPTEEWSH